MPNPWQWAQEWCNAHNFQWVVIHNHFYWQTCIQTAEITPDRKIHWHEKDYFDKIIDQFLNETNF